MTDINSVTGKNAVVFFYDGGVWKLYACGTGVSLNVVTEFIETSVSGSGTFGTFVPTKTTFTGSIDGITSLEMYGMLGLPDLRQRQMANTIFLMRFQRTSKLANVYTDEALFFITSSQDSGSISGMDVYTIQVQGTGPLTQVFDALIPVPIGGVLVRRYEYTGVGGETGFTADGTGGTPDLRGVYILEVNKDGDGFSPIITSGTPVGTEVKYISGLGQFVFPMPFETGEEAYILYQDI